MTFNPTHSVTLPADRRTALLELQKHLGLASKSEDRIFRFEKATFVLGQIVVSADRRVVAYFLNGICPVGFVRLENVLSDLRRRVAQDQVAASSRSMQDTRRAAAVKRRNVDAQFDDREISVAFDKPKAAKDVYALTSDERADVIQAYREQHGICSENEIELQQALRQARNEKQRRVEAENHAKKLELKLALKAKKTEKPIAKADKKAKKEKQKKAA